MVVASSLLFGYRQRRTASKVNPLRLKILHVSTFAAKILRGVEQPRPNELKDLACPTSGRNAGMVEFPQLSPVLSRFYQQLLLTQRFWPCSRANLMIPKDHGGRGIHLKQRRRAAGPGLPFVPGVLAVCHQHVSAQQ